MKTNLVKAVFALTFLSAAALAAPHQFSTVELLTSGNVPDQKVSATIPEKTQSTSEVLANKTEYIISNITQPSADESCTIEDVYTVKLMLLDAGNGELRMYDADANLLGTQLVALGDEAVANDNNGNQLDGSTDDKPNTPVNKKPASLNQPINSKIVLPIDIDGKRIANFKGQVPNSKPILPVEGAIRHAIDHEISYTTEDRSGNDRVTLCLLRYKDFIAAKQLQANITCKDMLVKITCPEINVFTTVVLKSKCNSSKISYERNFPID